MPELYRVDIREIIRLIGEHLYTTPDVVVRELIQNAYDSILSRYGQAASKEGRITVLGGRSPATLQITDNGTGMDRQELVDYLSTLGQGIKKAGNMAKDGGPIGEFGIGFFSSFMIADEIIVTTRKVGTEKTLRWQSHGIEEYDIDEISSVAIDFGTEVKIVLQRGSAKYSNAASLRQIIMRYCDYLSCSIYLDSEVAPVNVGLFPWEAGPSKTIGQQIERHLGRQPFFWTSSRATAPAQSAQFFLAISGRTKGSHTIYCKRMFVTDNLQFLPDHLNFIEVVLNSDSLSLGMHREMPVQNKTFRSLVESIEEATMTWLRKLVSAERADVRFIRVMREHQAAFRRMALESRGAFDKLHEFILFHIAGSTQSVTIGEYLDRSQKSPRRVFFIHERGDEEDPDAIKGGLRRSDRLMLAAAQESGVVVIGIRSEEDEELLRKVCTRVGATKAPLERYREEFLRTSIDPPAVLERVRKNFERFLNTSAQLREFRPLGLPILLEEHSIALNVASPFLPVLGNFTGHFERVRPLYIHLHRIMRALDKTGLAKEDLIEVTGMLTGALETWCEEVAEHSRTEDQLKELSERWWVGPSSLDSLAQAVGSFRRDGRVFRYRCFIACPFTPPYQDVVNVVRSVLIPYGVYAETAEAIDTRALMEKICLRIDQCHFAIVDVSESNPNVLFELGILLARRKPAVIIRNTEIAEWAGARVPSDVVGVERVEYQNTSEDLRSKLTKLCQRVFGEKNAEEP